jgi:hypothetical protein
MAGEFVSGRLIGGDWGLTGHRDEALCDMREAAAKLRRMGYEVKMK